MSSHECSAQDEHAYRYALLMVELDNRRTRVVWSVALCSMIFCLIIVLAAMHMQIWWYGFGTVPMVAIVYFTTRWARRAPDSVSNALADCASAYAGVPIRQRVMVTKDGVILNVSEAELAEHNEGRGILNAFISGWQKQIPSNDEASPSLIKPASSEQQKASRNAQTVKAARRKG